MNINLRHEIMLKSIERMKTLNFGDPVTNICAGEGNPSRTGYFVHYKPKQRKNKFGLVHHDHFARITDGKGKFWNTGIEVVYKGNISPDECKSLFEPVWQAFHGKALEEV